MPRDYLPEAKDKGQISLGASLQPLLLLLSSCPVMSASLRPHGLQHARPPCPSPSPRIYSSSCWSHQWCHPAVSSSDALFSFCPQSFPSSGTFPMGHLFTSDDQNAEASASVLPISVQGWFPLRLTGLTSLLSKGLSGVFSSSTVQKHQFFGVLPSLRSSSHNHTWPLGRPQPWLYRPLLAGLCLCFSTHCLGLSSLSCQEVIAFWFHGCSHQPQWFWSPGRGNLSLRPPCPLLFAMQ